MTKIGIEVSNSLNEFDLNERRQICRDAWKSYCYYKQIRINVYDATVILSLFNAIAAKELTSFENSAVEEFVKNSSERYNNVVKDFDITMAAFLISSAIKRFNKKKTINSDIEFIKDIAFQKMTRKGYTALCETIDEMNKGEIKYIRKFIESFAKHFEEV